MNALVCSTRLPEYDRECGSRRVFDFVQLLQDAGWQVTYVARDAERDDRYARMLRQAGVATYIGLDTLSETFLSEGRFDLALLEYWHVAEACIPRLRRWSPGTRLLVDSHDLHFLRNSRAAFRDAEGLARGGLASAIGEEFVRELNTYAHADGVLAVSEKETAVIADFINAPDAVTWVPLCEAAPRAGQPFRLRRGMLFVGNFWHQPNVDAAAHLVNDILPHVDPALLADHPLWIVGNASDAKAGALRTGPHVRVVGWVPSLTPYLSRVRVSAVPLRYGAGTKGKLIESLAAGTPVVSTSIGVEGLELRHDEDLLIADDPRQFAAALEILLTDEARWTRLAEHGPQRLTEVHGRDAVARRFFAAIATVLARAPKTMPQALAEGGPLTAYEQIRGKVRSAIERATPPGARIAVISKGDDGLLIVDGRRAEHFPQLADGRYAGFYPQDGAAAVDAVEAARARGVEYLAVPSTSAWWLEHYRQLADHLRMRGSLVLQDASCAIYALDSSAVRAAVIVPSVSTASTPKRRRRSSAAYHVEQHRPSLAPHLRLRAAGERPRVLALGIYLPSARNNAVDESRVLRETTCCVLDQRWVALGGAPLPAMADVTVASITEKTPKFAVLNRLLADADLARVDYLLLIDDDIVLPHGFLDALIGVQRQLDFVLAQPARTSDSYLDHPIVEQQRGVLARQTMFVEIGPVTSIHRSLFDALLPFDATSPMGWGYENVWAHQVRERGLKMGIIDAVPVSHSMRKPVANYSWDVADTERHLLLARQPHVELDECFRVLDVIELGSAHA